MGAVIDSNATNANDESLVDGTIRDPVSGLKANVELIGGKNRLLSQSEVQVNTTLGLDPFADVFFTIDTAGATNDTVRIQIEAVNDPTGTERDLPAVDVTSTITATEDGKELLLRDLIISDLNADSNFQNAGLKAQVGEKDSLTAVVHITSLDRGEYHERLGATGVQVTPSGTTTITLDSSELKQREKIVSLARDPDSPHRLGILGIAGSVTVTPGAISDLYIENAKNGGSPDMQVNGSVTPVDFTIAADANDDLFIEEIRFYGGGNGIKFGKFLSQNSALTNGIQVQIKSDNQTTTLPMIKTTEDFKNKFAFGSGANFRIDVQAGADQFLAVLLFENPFPIRVAGAFPSDDFLKITINDNLSTGIIELELLSFGFRRAP